MFADTTMRYFNFYVPLKMLLYFAEDYTRVMMNIKLELTYVCWRRNAMINSSTSGTLKLINAHWKIPYVREYNAFCLPLL